MKKIYISKIMCVFFVFLLVFSLCSCNMGKKSDVKEEISLYFVGKNTSNLVNEDYEIINAKNTDEALNQAMNALLLGPKKKENKRIIREGTRLLSASMANAEEASVNLSKEFYNENNIYDILAASSIVKSLCSINGIKKVSIFVEGMPLISPTGEELGALTENDLIFDITSSDQNEVNVKLYFSDKEAMYFVKENRKINVPTGESVEKLIVSELIKGPVKDKAVKTIPAETKIRSVETKEGVCFVNLSNEFVTKHSGGSAAEYMTIYSIVNSLTELSHIEKVQFLIEGEKKDVFIHFTFNEPFMRDEAMIR